MTDSKILDFLRCPLTKSKLRFAGQTEIDKVNELIERGEIKDNIGNAISTKLTGGLINADSTILMKVEDDIINTIPDELIVLPPQIFQ